MECKVFPPYKNSPCHLVLIETLWNVKKPLAEATQKRIAVLIETLWNVKIIGLLILTISVTCINRNIVECKARYLWVFFYRDFVLIETLWNVKTLFQL